MSRLPESFYHCDDVVEVARALVGKKLVTSFEGNTTSGIITETEAYHQSERACHAYNGRYTQRTKILFEQGGTAYVYLCYGIHCLLNVTTGAQGEAAAVLIRAIQPLDGLSYMLERRRMTDIHPRISAGPGKLTKAMGVTLTENGKSIVYSQDLWIEAHQELPDPQIGISTRIGVDYAGKDSLLPWRFFLKGNKWVSRAKTVKFL